MLKLRAFRRNMLRSAAWRFAAALALVSSPLQAHAQQAMNFNQANGTFIAGRDNAIVNDNGTGQGNFLFGSSNKIIEPIVARGPDGTIPVFNGFTIVFGKNNTFENSALGLVTGEGNVVNGSNFYNIYGEENHLSATQRTHIVGDQNVVTGQDVRVLGNRYTINSNNVLAFGSNGNLGQRFSVGPGLDGAVVFDDNAIAASKVEWSSINGQWYRVAGQPASSGMVMMMGGRQIRHIAAGEVSDGSTDAVNGSQLFAANQAIGDIGNQIKGFGDTISGVRTEITHVSTEIGNKVHEVDGRVSVLGDNITNITKGTAGLVQQEGGAPGQGDITIGKDTGGTLINVAGKDGKRRLSGLSAGQHADEAVNLAQLTDAINAFGGAAHINADGSIAAPSYNISNHVFHNVGDALGNVDGRLINVEGNVSRIVKGTEGIVQQQGGSPGRGDITIGKSTGGKFIQIAGTDGDRNITGVLAGKKHNDAVNVAQLSKAIDGFGGGAHVNADGSVTGPTYKLGGKTFHNVGDALGHVDHRVTSLEGNMTKVLKGTAGLVQQQGGSPGQGDITIGKDTGGTRINVAGKDGNRIITGVLSGRKDSDAVNVGQLAKTVHALGGKAHINADGSITAPTYQVGGKDYHTVGAALKATNSLSVQYVPDHDGNPTNSVILHGGKSGPVSIGNLADGKLDSDAATVRQLRKSSHEGKAYTDRRVNELATQTSNQVEELSGEILQSRKEARAGISSAMAASALRFDPRPGKTSVSAAIGGFKGSASLAAGLGYTSADGLLRLNTSVAHSLDTNDTAWNAGFSMTID